MTQETALTLMKMGHNVFLTGSPGSGKTYTLNLYKKFLDEHGIEAAITAPTGIAASHINGVTVQSFFGTGIRDSLSPWDIEQLMEKKYMWERIKDLKVVVIDEISMLSPALFRSLDQLLKTFKMSDAPFGGLQVVLIGDFFQLPPVSSSPEERFVFETEVWDELELATCYLETSHRHTDNTLLGILEEIRRGDVSEESMEHFRSRYRKDPDHLSDITKLYTHNRDVDAINMRELEALATPLHVCNAQRTGQKKYAEKIFDTSLVLETLRLKEGALVFFIKNNYEKGYINGTLGTVTGFSDLGYPLITTHHGQEIIASPEEWKFEDHNGNVKATISQVPLRLAWAITVHKSQGMTLPGAEIDLSSAFEPGQGYVALSRITELRGLKLMGMNEHALKVDERVHAIDTAFRDASHEYSTQINALSDTNLKNEIDDFISRVGSITKKKEIQKNKARTPKKTGRKGSHRETLPYILDELPLDDIAKKRDYTVGTIVNHIQKLLDDGERMTLDYLKPSSEDMQIFQKTYDRLIAKNDPEHFTEDRELRLRALHEALDKAWSYDDIKVALLFIE